MDERIGRILQRVEDHENDIRAFAPLVNEFSDWRAETRTEIRTLKGDLKEMREQHKLDAQVCQAGIAAVHKRLDEEAKERAKERQATMEKEAERERTERKDRFVRNTTLAMLILVFVSTSAGVIALVLA